MVKSNQQTQRWLGFRCLKRANVSQPLCRPFVLQQLEDPLLVAEHTSGVRAVERCEERAELDIDGRTCDLQPSCLRPVRSGTDAAGAGNWVDDPNGLDAHAQVIVGTF